MFNHSPRSGRQKQSRIAQNAGFSVAPFTGFGTLNSPFRRTGLFSNRPLRDVNER